jgi:hypothetical protein
MQINGFVMGGKFYYLVMLDQLSYAVHEKHLFESHSRATQIYIYHIWIIVQPYEVYGCSPRHVSAPELYFLEFIIIHFLTNVAL